MNWMGISMLLFLIEVSQIACKGVSELIIKEIA